MSPFWGIGFSAVWGLAWWGPGWVRAARRLWHPGPRAVLAAKADRDRRALRLRALGMSEDDARRAIDAIDALGEKGPR